MGSQRVRHDWATLTFFHFLACIMCWLNGLFTPSVTSGPCRLCVQEIWALSHDGAGLRRPSNIHAYAPVGYVWPGLIGGVRPCDQYENRLGTSLWATPVVSKSKLHLGTPLVVHGVAKSRTRPEQLNWTKLVAWWLRIHLPVQGIDPWPRKIPHALGQLNPCATITEALMPWSPCSETSKATAMRSPQTARRE